MYIVDNVDKEISKIMRDAGQAILTVYEKQNFTVAWKGVGDPVTEADFAAHEIYTKNLSVFGYPVISEEGVRSAEYRTAEYFWLVDPLDGTRDFIERTGDFCSMVALIHAGSPILAAVYIPLEEALYFAEKGKGAFVERNGVREQIFVSKRDELGDARALISRTHKSKGMQDLLAEIGPQIQTSVGSNGIKAARIADGQYDFFFNPTNKMGEWDVAAPQLLVEEAGGIASGFSGEALTYGKNIPITENGVLFANTALYEDVLAQIVSWREQDALL